MTLCSSVNSPGSNQTSLNVIQIENKITMRRLVQYDLQSLPAHRPPAGITLRSGGFGGIENLSS